MTEEPRLRTNGEPRGAPVTDSDSAEEQGGRRPRVHQEAEARRDAYIAGRDQFVFHADAALQCSCGIYAAGACRVCGLPLCGRHGELAEGLFLCDAHRQAAALRKKQRRGGWRFRPRYIHQVTQVFAGDLLDRETELAELSEFATSDDGCPYVWWQGDAWTGKSALLAAFVLNAPPAVRVISFFITARFAGQSDRAAFLEAVLGQLSELLGQAAPDALTESAQQTWFLDLLGQAAEKCAEDGYRLVLVVDGLDEDRGMSAGGNVHSIAALLPGRPPAGVRVILAGRPAPPLPGDVPAWHPLRDPAIVRPLSQSAHAVVMRGDTQRELARLLEGGGLGRELLGFVVTAGGGLAGEDLAELTEEPVGEVERILHTVTGRTFAGRDRQWGDSPGHVFVLAHEELQQAALRSLRSSELTRWRDRIHVWADGYRERGWPEGTPEYLLRGYLRLLRGAGDLARMVALSTDVVRLNRMLDVSGGDAASLADIRAVQGYVMGQPCPDLAAALCLAYAARDLVNRNSSIPIQLPAVWAVLGNLNRAEALTQSIGDSGDRAEALGHLSMAVAETGNAVRAERLLDDAVAAAHSILGPIVQGRVLAFLSRVVIGTGDLRRAESIARSVPAESTWDSHALIPLAVAYAESGDMANATNIAISCSRLSPQVEALASVAEVFAEVGDLGKARSVADDAEAIARSATDTWERALALAASAQVAVAAEDLDRARLLIDDAEATAYSATEIWQQASALAATAEAAVAAEDLDRARLLIDAGEAIARSIADESDKNTVFAELATAAVEAEDLGRAETIMRSVTGFPLASTLRSWSQTATESGNLERAEAIAHSITDLSQQAPALEYLSATIAENGDLDHAENIAYTIIQLKDRASTLASVARAAVEAGNLGRARLLAEKAESIARAAATDERRQTGELTSAARALAAAGRISQARLLAESAVEIAQSISQDSARTERSSALAWAALAVAAVGNLDMAEGIIRLISEDEFRASMLASVAQAAAESGDLDRATCLVGEAEAVLAPYDGRRRPSPMESIAVTVAETGNLDRATDIARSLAESSCQASALASVARIAAEAGDSAQAWLLIAEAEDIISSVEPNQLHWPLQALSGALCAIGEMERSESVARSIPQPYLQGRALEELAERTAKCGDLSKAESIVRTIVGPQAQGEALASLARVISDRGDVDKARHILAESLIACDPFAAVPAIAAIDSSVVEITMRHLSKYATKITVQRI
jgi:tetratricopeptide (TPR) repeat protein